jgi:hypothetical protein
MDTWVEVFIAATAVAVVLQLVILVALFVSVKKTTDQMQKMAAEVHSRTLPLLDVANGMLADTRPRLDVITNNLAETTVIVKKQMERLEVTVDDIVDRTRLQIIRADELVGRTLDRVEETTDIVHHTVISPVKQAAGIIQGLTTAVGAFMGGVKKKPRKPGDVKRTQDEELFI